MREFLTITKALADESRVRALAALIGGELCVCQLIELLSLAPSTVSKHMSLLHQAGLVQTRKDGRWIYYRVSESPERSCAAALRMVEECLADDGRIRQDALRLECIRRMSLDALCACYHEREAP